MTTIAVLALIVAAICLPVTREVRALRKARLRLEAALTRCCEAEQDQAITLANEGRS